MPDDRPVSHAPLMTLFAPPAGLPKEWESVYRILADRLFVAYAFYSHPDIHLHPLESLASWENAFRNIEKSMTMVLPYLRGRAPRTWNIGHAIENAVGRIQATLTDILIPLPIQQEQHEASVRARLADLKGGFDPRPMLDDLAAAVTSESTVLLNLPSGVGEARPAPDVVAAAVNSDPEYVTLDQMAARVNRSKRTLERLKTRGSLPAPDVEGGGGKPDEWIWSRIRPWLETTFNRQLPERFRADRP